MTLDTYREQRGQKPHRVTIVERPDKGLTVWLRWTVDGKPKSRMTAVRTIRDPRGRVQKRAIEKAQAEADEKVAELKGERRPSKRARGPLTLRDGVALAFTVSGPYHQDPKKDSWTRQAKSYADQAVRLLGGDDVLWEDVTPGMIRAVWRKIEKEAGGRGDGYRKAEKILVCLFRIATWLQGEFQDQRFPAPLKGWRGELKGHWKKLGHDTTPERPRHTRDEVEAIYAARAKGDPRIRLALAIGGRLRGGQVIRTMRSDYDPERGIQCRRGCLGRIAIPYVSERKRAPALVLNWRERLELEHALRLGYLSELEAARKRGLIADYPLFPGGKLRKGKAPVRAKMRAMHPTSIADLFHDLERAAKVEPVEGRGWHGMRRQFSDQDETASEDERVKERLGGWGRGSAMRKTIYQEQESAEVDIEAAQVRARRRTTSEGE